MAVLPACAEYSATPARLQSNYGASVRNMVNNQIYNPAAAQHPAALAPNGIEGNKSERVMEKAYRNDIGNPPQIEQKSTLGVIGRGGSSGSSGSSR
jgi:hypothetical protein